MPRVFAVLTLTTRSNLVGCSTGMSPGFSPRKILSTIPAARRNISGKWPVRHESPSFGEVACCARHRQLAIEREGHETGGIGRNHSGLYEIDCISMTFEGIKSRRDIVIPLHAAWHDCESKFSSRNLDIFSFTRACGIGGVKQNCQLGKPWNDFAQEFEPLTGDFGLLDGDPRSVAAWMRKVGDQSAEAQVVCTRGPTVGSSD